MAKYYGHESGYLKRKKFKYRLYLIIVFAAVLAIALKISTMDTAEYWWLIAAALILFIYPLIVMNEKFNLLAFFVNRGLTGESVIREELLRLPDDYAVFEDVMFEHKKGNIDFIVSGPTGVYAIEVKSHRGHVEHHKGRIYVNGYPKNFLAQTWSEKRSLEDFLSRKGVRLEPLAVLVFSSRSQLKFGFQPVEGVYVFGREYLLELILRGRVPNHSRVSVEKATEALIDHYSRFE